MEALDPEKSQEFTKEQIRLAAAGNQDALSQLYQQTYHRVYVTVKSMLQDEDAVLDIVQDSYVKAFQSLDQLDKPGNFCAWMKRIATNKTKDYFKKKKPILFSEMVTEDDEELDFEDDRFQNLPDAVIDRKETTRLINEILGTLSEEQRLAIGMFYYEQMSVAEIAEALGCSQNTVKSRLNYGRKKVETKVRDLEKQGTKLYSLAPLPFLLWLLSMDAEAVMLPGEAAQAEQIWSAVRASTAESATAGTPAAATSSAANSAAETSTAANSAAASAANSTAAAAGKTAAGAGLKAAGGKLLAGKIIAGILAVTVVAGSITAAVKSGSSGQHDTAQTAETTAAVTEAQPLSEEQLHDMFDSVLQEYQEGMAQQNFQADSWVHTGRNAEYAMEKYHEESGHNFYYTFYDINRDGQGELLTGYSTGDQICIVGVYSSVDGKIYPVHSTPELGTYGVTLQILDDGSLYHLVQHDGVIDVQIIITMTEDGTASRTVAKYNAQAQQDGEGPQNKELVDELLSQHKPVEIPDWKLIAAPEQQQTVPPAEAEAVYEPVKNEYRKAMCATESTYVQFDYKYLHPDSSSALFYYHLNTPDSKFYTADYDINHDGTQELLIGLDIGMGIQLVDVYSYDGTQPVQLLYQSALGSDAGQLQIMTDGTMYYSAVLDAQSSVHSLYKMAEDGRSAKETATCLYTAGEDDGELTAIQDQVAACTPVTDFPWTELTADKEQFAPGDADIAFVESKKIVEAYWEVYQMSDDEFNNDPDIYERYPYFDEMMWACHAGSTGRQFYYAVVDIDGDGISELLIGYGKRGDIQPCNSFAWNGQEMERLGAEGKCDILADGTVVDHVGNGGEIAGVYKLENSRLVENPDTEFPLGMDYDYNAYQDAVNAHGGLYQPEWTPVSGHHD